MLYKYVCSPNVTFLKCINAIFIYITTYGPIISMQNEDAINYYTAYTINNCYILVFALDDTVKFIADLFFSKLSDVFIGNLSYAGKLAIGFVQEQFYTMKRKVSSKIQIYENQ